MAKDDKKKLKEGSYTSGSTKDDEIILDIFCEAIKKRIGKTHDGKIRSGTWAETIKKYNEKTGLILLVKIRENIMNSI